MSKSTIVVSALAAALAAGAAEAATAPDTSRDGTVASEPHSSQSAIISAAARELLLKSASEAAERSFQTAATKNPKFKLFDNGPTFVKAAAPRKAQ
jgi:hypothetical protein